MSGRNIRPLMNNYICHNILKHLSYARRGSIKFGAGLKTTMVYNGVDVLEVKTGTGKISKLNQETLESQEFDSLVKNLFREKKS